VQVFDDGRSTYFQFRAGDPVPVIFKHQSGTVNLLVPSPEGPYMRVPEIGGRFTLQLGRTQAQVIYGGSGRETPTIEVVDQTGARSAPLSEGQLVNQGAMLRASIPPVPSTVVSSLETNSYATPAKGDRVTWKDSETEVIEQQVFFARGSAALNPQAKKALAAMADFVRGGSSITVIGRDDASEKEGLEKLRASVLRSELIKVGAAAENITVRYGVMGSPKDKLWPSDVRFERVVPTAIAKPSDARSDRTSHLYSNVESLVRAGVLTREQGAAILLKGNATAPDQIVQPVAQASAAAVPKAAEIPAAGFDFKAADKNVSTVIRRWAQATSYEVVWDAPSEADAPVIGDAVIAASSMREALDKVVSALQRKGYDIQATLYSNRVIRFTGGKQ
jgi:outer membrane protein OmpA-like peptidoglycan-associated protein